MRNSPILGVQIPDASDVADVPTDLYRIVTGIEKRTIPVFASAAARNSAFTAAGVTPTDGLRCFLNDTKTTQVYLGGVWLNQESSVVCTSTSRPNPSHVGMQIYETNTKMYRTWDGTVWKQSSPGVATAATRATPLHVGQETYDTDTKELRFWDGTQWVPTGMKWVGSYNALLGASGSAASQLKMLAGSSVVTTDGTTGEATLNYGYTFTGVASVIVANGDATVGGANTLALVAALVSHTLSGATVRMYRESTTTYTLPAGGVDRGKNLQCRINWAVFGW